MVHVRVAEIEAYAKEHKVPIMLPDGIDYLTRYIEAHKCRRILEIGSAIGYSAIKMALVDPKVHVTTIERDLERYQMALANIKACHLEDQITVLYGDAFDVTVPGFYDLIFIDAAKSQYIKFFERFKDQLVIGGTVISDNLEFHGLTHSTEPIASRNLRSLIRKINAYITFLEENEEFDTTFLTIGDGLGVSVKKKG
ncbi:MAG: O-methyltransferase [Bacilli bacterium]|jgi:predicted O-methyltransferase YrrM|nr:O-methyltransferase [Bacilli bacterium]